MKHLILGNGPAGVVAAETLRKVAPADDILMVGFEDAPPYSRMAIPYLLEGNIDESGTYLRKGVDHFERLRIRQLRGRAVALDAAKRKVLFDDGHFEHYDRLLIATGSHPVRPPIPGVDLPSVHTCWTLADARAIAAHAKPGARVLQLGAGFTAKDDNLPPRLTQEPAKTGPAKGLVNGLAKMLPEYYQVRGWTPGGEPTAETRARLGL